MRRGSKLIKKASNFDRNTCHTAKNSVRGGERKMLTKKISNFFQSLVGIYVSGAVIELKV